MTTLTRYGLYGVDADRRCSMSAHMVYLHNRGKAHMVYLQYRGKNLGSYESSALGNGRCLFLTISIVLLEGFSSS